MSLREKAESVSALLADQPALERLASLKTVTTKLSKAIDDFLEKSRPAIYKNTAEFAELFSLLTQSEYKSVVTLEWLNRYHDGGQKLTKTGKKEKEDFAVAMVSSGRAKAVIKELKESPRRRMQDKLYALARLTDSEAAEQVKSMKPKELEEFCLINEIAAFRSAKGSLDKKKTTPSILEKLGELREYLKL